MLYMQMQLQTLICFLSSYSNANLNAHFIIELQYSACFYGFTINHVLRKSCVQRNVKYVNWPKCALELKLLNFKNFINCTDFISTACLTTAINLLQTLFLSAHEAHAALLY